MNKIYTPILKAKYGETVGVSNLPDTVLDKILPLWDIPRLSEDQTTPSDVSRHIYKACRAISENWSREKYTYIDLYDVDPNARCLNNIHPIHYTFELLQKDGIKAIPVIALDRDLHYLSELKKIAPYTNNNICIRLQLLDLVNPEETIVRLENLFDELSLRTFKQHLIIDLRSIATQQINRLLSVIVPALSVITNKNFYRIVVAGSSIPESLSFIRPNSHTEISRKELEIWSSITSSTQYNIAYGDYGIIHPNYTDLDPRLIKPAAKIRYCADTQWIVIKGIQWRKNTKQHKELCNKLVHMEAYRHGDSWGEQFISECARGRQSYGNLGTWVSVDTNVHIDFASKQIEQFLLSRIGATTI